MAIFLLHGNADPLVPVSELPLLEKRLAAFTIVSTFESHLLGHTTVGEAGWGDRFDHIVWLDDFFDMVGG